MAKSLNDAFIRAYSKSNSEASQPDEDQPAEQEDYLVRVDTTSVEVPSPHVIDRRKSPVSTPQATHHKQAVTPAVQEEPQVAETADLRESIADQMTRAGVWGENQIDAFSGGFPMVETPEERPRTPAARPTVANAEAPEIGEPKTLKIHTPPTPDLAEVPTMEPLRSEAAAAEPVSEVVEEASPAPTVVPQPSMSPEEVESIVQRYVEQHGRKGEIFRLDRPTYTELDQAAEESESILDHDSSSEPSQTDLDLEPAEEEPPIEEQLRIASDQQFTPVWEVDNFQWPAVCDDLLKLAEEPLSQVAKNLVAACQEGLVSLLVTSIERGQGRTTVACCLARLAAAHGLRVVLVDGDLENPTLSYQTNIEVDEDWCSALHFQHPLEEVAVHSIEDRVTLIPLLHPLSADEISASDSRIATMIHELTQSFDLVLVDTGPLASPRNLVTSLGEQGVVHAVVNVMNSQANSAEQVETHIRRIKKLGISSIGLVENNVG